MESWQEDSSHILLKVINTHPGLSGSSSDKLPRNQLQHPYVCFSKRVVKKVDVVIANLKNVAIYLSLNCILTLC